MSLTLLTRFAEDHLREEYYTDNTVRRGHAHVITYTNQNNETLSRYASQTFHICWHIRSSFVLRRMSGDSVRSPPYVRAYTCANVYRVILTYKGIVRLEVFSDGNMLLKECWRVIRRLPFVRRCIRHWGGRVWRICYWRYSVYTNNFVVIASFRVHEFMWSPACICDVKCAHTFCGAMKRMALSSVTSYARTWPFFSFLHNCGFVPSIRTFFAFTTSLHITYVENSDEGNTRKCDLLCTTEWGI